MAVSDQLKAAIEKAEAKGETRYKIAQESRVDYTVLVRFLELGRASGCRRWTGSAITSGWS